MIKITRIIILFIIIIVLIIGAIEGTKVTGNVEENTKMVTKENVIENTEENAIEKLEFISTEIISNEQIDIEGNNQTSENKEDLFNDNKKIENSFKNAEISIVQNVEENETSAIQTQAKEITSTFNENAFNGWHLKTYPKFAEQYATLIINKIGVNAPVYFGDTKEIILKGVGHDMGSYFFGEGGSIVLCEHNYMNNFRRLRRTKERKYYRNKNELWRFLL